VVVAGTWQGPVGRRAGAHATFHRGVVVRQAERMGSARRVLGGGLRRAVLRDDVPTWQTRTIAGGHGIASANRRAATKRTASTGSWATISRTVRWQVASATSRGGAWPREERRVPPVLPTAVARQRFPSAYVGGGFRLYRGAARLAAPQHLL